MPQRILVFGSNLKGFHGAGSAYVAHNSWGAEWGVGVGRTGFAYAIPTKYYPSRDPKAVIPLEKIEVYVRAFIIYALAHPELIFDVVAIGTGYAGYKHEQIAPLFHGAPGNCVLPREWEGLYE